METIMELERVWGRLRWGTRGRLTFWWHRIKAADYFCGPFNVSLVFSEAMCACKRCIICVISGWMHLIISKNHFTNRCLLLLFLVLIILSSCKLFFFPWVLVFPLLFFLKAFSSRAILPLKTRMCNNINDTVKLWKMFPSEYFNITTRFVQIKKMNFYHFRIFCNVIIIQIHLLIYLLFIYPGMSYEIIFLCFGNDQKMKRIVQNSKFYCYSFSFPCLILWVTNYVI